MEDRARHVSASQRLRWSPLSCGLTALALSLVVTPAKSAPRTTLARASAVRGEHEAVIAGLGAAPRTPEESALYATSLARVGKRAEAVKLLRGCAAKWRCAAALGRLELRSGDRRRAVKWLAQAMKSAPADLSLQVDMGEALYEVGQAAKARRLLDPMADRYGAGGSLPVPDLVAIARSLALNGYFKDANRVYADASDAAADSAERKLVELHWGLLFLSKYNFRDADAALRKVLKIDPRAVAAQVAMVRIDLDSDRDPKKAKKRLSQALNGAPHDPRLLALRGEIALHDERPREALEWTDKALAASPSHRQSLAVRYAALALLGDQRRAAETLKRAKKSHPSDPLPHLVAARYLEAAHRYDLVLKQLKTALKRDVESSAALAALGMSYARLADDKRAFRSLESAFRLDPYNVRTANVLNLLYDGVLKQMPVLKGTHVDLRVHRRHKLALERAVLPFLQRSYRVLSKKYAMEAKKPLRVEIFPSTEQFSVRTVGLPSLGAHAVCFGHLITSRSPAERPFNWKMVLHHEMAHVFHIQASEGRVPRWLTEGLAMMESAWLDERYHMRSEERLWARLRQGKLSKLATFNLAFSQARSMKEIADAYYQAMQLTAFLNESYGFEKLRALVAAHRGGETTATLVKRIYGKSSEQLDDEFKGWLRKHLAHIGGSFHPSRGELLKAWQSKEVDLEFRQAHQAMADSKSDRAKTTAALDKAARKGVSSKSSALRCGPEYVLMSLAFRGRRWKEVVRWGTSLVTKAGCDGVRQRLMWAQALKELGQDPFGQVSRARALHPWSPKPIALALRWERAPTKRRRWLSALLRLSPNDPTIAKELGALAWRAQFPHGLLSASQAERQSSKDAQVDPHVRVDVQQAARQLEETVPHSAEQALWEARSMVLSQRWRAASLVYPLVAARASTPKMRSTAFCELKVVAQKLRDSGLEKMATARCKGAERPQGSPASP